MKKTKIRYVGYIIPLIIIFLAMLGTYYEQYENTVKLIKFAYKSNLDLTEKNINNEIKHIEIIENIEGEDIKDYLDKDLKNIFSDIKNKNPFIKDISLYIRNNNKEYNYGLNRKTTEYSGNSRNKYVERALETKRVQEIRYEENGNISTIKYIPYISRNNDKGLHSNSYVAEVVYNDEIIGHEIVFQRKSFVRNIIILAMLYFGSGIIIILLLDKNYRIAHQDNLTKLANRKSFRSLMTSMIKEASRKDFSFLVLFFDLNKFKEINDTYGHAIGDEVLKEAARRLKNGVSKEDIVARLGGDEFISIISCENRDLDPKAIGEYMSHLFDPPLILGSLEINIETSIGISIYSEHGEEVEELITKADHAMYESKKQNLRYVIYNN